MATVKYILLFVGACWALLVLTTSGVLIKSERLADTQRDVIVCHYFTGLGVIKREYWTAESSLFGRDVCKRIVAL